MIYVHFKIFYTRNNNLTPHYAFQQRLCISNYVVRKRVSIATNINVRWYLLSPLGPLNLLSSTLHSQITHSTRSMTQSDPRLPHTNHTYQLIRFENILPMNVPVFSTRNRRVALWSSTAWEKDIDFSRENYHPLVPSTKIYTSMFTYNV